MSRWHNYYLDDHVHFCTYAVRAWTPLLDHNVVDCIYAQWTINSQRFDVKILGYVIMPEHIHMLIWSHKGRNVMRFLQRTLGQISKLAFPGVGRVWKERPHVFPLTEDGMFPEKLDYIHRNPVRRKLVVSPEEWLHSSYNQLYLGKVDVPFVCDIMDLPFAGR